jgi:hypothetical protein
MIIDKNLEDKISQFLNFGRCEYVENNTLKLCYKCKGLGSYETEKLTDYHRNEYTSTQHICNVCRGDGRLIESVKKIVFTTRDTSEVMPYIGNEHLTKENFSLNVRLKIDNRCPLTEQKYPDLKDLTYTRYDDMLRNIRIEEALVSDNDRKKDYPF